jgi:hypothetical protein
VQHLLEQGRLDQVPGEHGPTQGRAGQGRAGINAYKHGTHMRTTTHISPR